MASTATCCAEFPPTLLDLLRLQGAGPEDRRAALPRAAASPRSTSSRRPAKAGRLRGREGPGREEGAAHPEGHRGAAALVGRHLLADVAATAAALVACLREHAPAGDHRAGRQPAARRSRPAATSTSSSPAADASIMDVFTSAARRRARPRPRRHEVERAAERRPAGRPAARARRRAAAPRMQYFTGFEGAQHRAARSRARARAARSTSTASSGSPTSATSPATPRRASTRRSGSPWIPPELRENRGEIDAGRARRAARARRRATTSAATSTCTRPRPTAATTSRRWRAPRATRASSTSRSPITARRWRWPTASTSDARSRTRRASARSATASRASRCSPASSATSAPTARSTSPTTASRSSTSSSRRCTRRSSRTPAQMTERVLRAIANPVGRRARPSRPGGCCCGASRYRRRRRAVVDAAAAHGVALEINCQVDRLDLSDVHARLARERGAPLVISTDAHLATAFGLLRWGVHGRAARVADRRPTCSTPALDELRPRLGAAARRDVGPPHVGFDGPQRTSAAVRATRDGSDDRTSEAAHGSHRRRSSGSTTRPQPATVSRHLAKAIALLKDTADGGGARARRRLHGRPVADALGVGGGRRRPGGAAAAPTASRRTARQ